ncbi:MAG: 50S ribosomal protein L1 [Candidatus Mycalebacterium zealandia]|nr:MAG: 50S ribosomal protein L1 [Candidatus Mycalebacterium zealandia]
MAKRGKRYAELREKIGNQSVYSVEEAVDLIPQTSAAKFDGSVDIAVKLGIDSKNADQQIRGSLVLPHGTGKNVRVLVFAKDAKAAEAKEAGADYAGFEDLVEKIEKENWLEFDVAIATPDVMSEVGKLGKFLGPRGLMPAPKMGTVTNEIATVVKQSKGGRIEFKNDKGSVVHAPLGKSSFEVSKIKENLVFMLYSLNKMKPASSKGDFFKKVSISNTMGPSINVDLVSIKEEIKAFAGRI